MPHAPLALAFDSEASSIDSIATLIDLAVMVWYLIFEICKRWPQQTMEIAIS